ncbi:hypothetical protein O0L34_g10086 [Tuta absoluta]|nr:hypothetical protein O0L34_g10086 [Tuta absoluta]
MSSSHNLRQSSSVRSSAAKKDNISIQSNCLYLNKSLLRSMFQNIKISEAYKCMRHQGSRRRHLTRCTARNMHCTSRSTRWLIESNTDTSLAAGGYIESNTGTTALSCSADEDMASII